MTRDIDDRGRDGTLPADPALEATRVRPPLRAVKPGERQDDDERALLGAILWAGTYEPTAERAKALESIVEPRMFRTQLHGAIFAALVVVETAGGATEPVAVATEVRKSGTNIEAANLTALTIEATAPSSDKLVGWAKSIREAWLCRQVAELGRLTSSHATGGRLSSAEALAETRARLEEIAAMVAGGAATMSLREATQEAIARVGKRSRAMATGLADLDSNIAGLFPQETSILAARTSVGKSALAALISRNIVESQRGTACLYVSLEMPAAAFSMRLIADHAGIPAKQIRHGKLTQEQHSAFVASALELAKLPIQFVTSTTQTLVDIIAAARQVSAALSLKGQRLAMIVIDHVGLVKPSAKSLEKASREQQVAETSRGLRYLAERFDCHVMGLVQINREGDKAGGMPLLRHLAESDSLARDADLTLILHREKTKTGMFNTEKPAALAIAKARNDETAMMLLSFDPRYVRFGNHADETSYEQWYGE